jgi:hypothetical protein
MAKVVAVIWEPLEPGSDDGLVTVEYGTGPPERTGIMSETQAERLAYDLLTPGPGFTRRHSRDGRSRWSKVRVG